STECLHLRRLSLGEKAISDATLVEHLDGAGVQTPRARALELEAGAPFDDDSVGPRQCQLCRQHHACGTSAGNHHSMLAHARTSAPMVRDGTASRTVGSTST